MTMKKKNSWHQPSNFPEVQNQQNQTQELKTEEGPKVQTESKLSYKLGPLECSVLSFLINRSAPADRQRMVEEKEAVSWRVGVFC